jgi:hypothetical protein
VLRAWRYLGSAKHSHKILFTDDESSALEKGSLFHIEFNLFSQMNV